MVPRPQRTLAEIGAQANAVHGGAAWAERPAAAALLSSAMDTAGMSQRLGEFQVAAAAGAPGAGARPEDAASVQEFLDAFTRNAVNAAMQTHISNSVERFDAFLDRRMDADWANVRQGLLRTTMGAPLATPQRSPAGQRLGLLQGGTPPMLSPKSHRPAGRMSQPSPEVRRILLVFRVSPHAACVLLTWRPFCRAAQR